MVIYDGVQGTEVGGTGTGQGNIISGNTAWGVIIDGNGLVTTTSNVILGNYIGTNWDGTAAIANMSQAVNLIDEGLSVFR